MRPFPFNEGGNRILAGALARRMHIFILGAGERSTMAMSRSKDPRLCQNPKSVFDITSIPDPNAFSAGNQNLRTSWCCASRYSCGLNQLHGPKPLLFLLPHSLCASTNNFHKLVQGLNCRDRRAGGTKRQNLIKSI